jgi:EmrB/QacA subfamily drug resistance transporter
MLFHFVTPIAAVILLLGFFLLTDKKEKAAIRLDGFSLVLSSVGFGGLLYGFSSAGSKGWTSPYVYVTIIIGIISLTAFVLRQSRLERPMLNFGVYRYPMFALSSVISMTITMAMFSGMLLIPIYVQTIRGFSPMEAGLMMLPGALLNAFMSPVTGRLFDKFGGRILSVSGLLIMTVTTYLLSILTLETSYTYLAVVHAVRMLGMAMVMMPVQTNGLNQLPSTLYPHGTAMNNTLQNVSGAIGTALLVTVMSTRTETYASRLGEEALQSTAQPTAEIQQQIMMKAMLEGINDAFLVSAIISIAALVLAFFMKRVKQAEELPGKITDNKKVRTS